MVSMNDPDRAAQDEQISASRTRVASRGVERTAPARSDDVRQKEPPHDLLDEVPREALRAAPDAGNCRDAQHFIA